MAETSVERAPSPPRSPPSPRSNTWSRWSARWPRRRSWTSWPGTSRRPTWSPRRRCRRSRPSRHCWPGAVQLRLTWVLPGAAPRAVGAPGTVTGVADASLEARPFTHAVHRRDLEVVLRAIGEAGDGEGGARTAGAVQQRLTARGGAPVDVVRRDGRAAVAGRGRPAQGDLGVAGGGREPGGGAGEGGRRGRGFGRDARPPPPR